MDNNTLWVEKYRPERVADCVLPDDIKKTFQGIVDSGDIPNMILSGTAGIGKTTIAKAICKEMGLDFMMINGSKDRNIDTLNGRIQSFASTVSLNGGVKVVIIDEADYLNPQSTQPALRAFIEENSSNCRFIFTCNLKSKIMKPLHSRCTTFDFNSVNQDLSKLSMEFYKRMAWILDNENKTFDSAVLGALIIKHAPDWRQVINDCQRYTKAGSLDKSVVSSTAGDDEYDKLFTAMKVKQFTTVRKWVVANLNTDVSTIFRGIYDRMDGRLAPHSIPSAIAILAEYQFRSAFVADHEINLMACLDEIMRDVEWK